jgi:hypothetical protein
MTIVKLRTEVVDERGRLGALACAIAAYGGNILGIDVHLLDGAHVADEFVIEFPGDHAADGLGTALRRAGGTQFLLERLEERAVLDPVVRAIDACAGLFGAESPERRLEACVADVVGADVVRLLPADAMPAAPAVTRPATEDGQDSPWVLVVPDPAGNRILVVERRAPAFSSSEIARVGALLRLAHAAADDARMLAEEARERLGPPRPLRRAPASFFRSRADA